MARTAVLGWCIGLVQCWFWLWGDTHCQSLHWNVVKNPFWQRNSDDLKRADTWRNILNTGIDSYFLFALWLSFSGSCRRSEKMKLDTCSTSEGCAVFTWSLYSTVVFSSYSQESFQPLEAFYSCVSEKQGLFCIAALLCLNPKWELLWKELDKCDGHYSWSLQADMWRTN